MTDGAGPPAWRKGLRNGLLLGALVLACALALGRGDLGALRDMPLAVLLSGAVHVPQLVMTGLGWRILLPPGSRPGTGFMTALRWYRESAAALLPAGGLVGQAAAARLLMWRGVGGDVAGATATVDVTMEAVSQLFFTLAGILLLIAGGGDGGMAAFALAGLGVAAAGAGAMVALQRRLPAALIERGLTRLARRFPKIRPSVVHELQAAILTLHTDPRRLIGAMTWHSLAWVLGAFEVMGVLWLLGHDVSLADALVIEALSQALRNAGFLLPGAIAVQEGAIVASAALVGVPAAPALALALVRRGREVAFALPGLIAWQRAERRGPCAGGG